MISTFMRKLSSSVWLTIIVLALLVNCYQSLLVTSSFNNLHPQPIMQAIVAATPYYHQNTLNPNLYSLLLSLLASSFLQNSQNVGNTAAFNNHLTSYQTAILHPLPQYSNIFASLAAQKIPMLQNPKLLPTVINKHRNLHHQMNISPFIQSSAVLPKIPMYSVLNNLLIKQQQTVPNMQKSGMKVNMNNGNRDAYNQLLMLLQNPLMPSIIQVPANQFRMSPVVRQKITTISTSLPRAFPHLMSDQFGNQLLLSLMFANKHKSDNTQMKDQIINRLIAALGKQRFANTKFRQQSTKRMDAQAKKINEVKLKADRALATAQMAANAVAKKEKEDDDSMIDDLSSGTSEADTQTAFNEEIMLLLHKIVIDMEDMKSDTKKMFNKNMKQVDKKIEAAVNAKHLDSFKGSSSSSGSSSGSGSSDSSSDDSYDSNYSHHHQHKDNGSLINLLTMLGLFKPESEASEVQSVLTTVNLPFEPVLVSTASDSSYNNLLHWLSHESIHSKGGQNMIDKNSLSMIMSYLQSHKNAISNDLMQNLMTVMLSKKMTPQMAAQLINNENSKMKIGANVASLFNKYDEYNKGIHHHHHVDLQPTVVQGQLNNLMSVLQRDSHDMESQIPPIFSQPLIEQQQMFTPQQIMSIFNNQLSNGKTNNNVGSNSNSNNISQGKKDNLPNEWGNFLHMLNENTANEENNDDNNGNANDFDFNSIFGSGSSSNNNAQENNNDVLFGTAFGNLLQNNDIASGNENSLQEQQNGMDMNVNNDLNSGGMEGIIKKLMSNFNDRSGNGGDMQGSNASDDDNSGNLDVKQLMKMISNGAGGVSSSVSSNPMISKVRNMDFNELSDAVDGMAQNFK